MILTGRIVKGKQLGRTLGFPTANLQADTAADCRRGVYAGLFRAEGWDAARPCLVNIGKHPTVPEGEPTIEAHLPGFCGDLYGMRVTIELTRFIREERKFADLDALKAQIAADIQSAMDISKKI